MIGLVVVTLLAAGAADRARVVVLDIQPGGGVDASVAATLTEVVTAEVQRTGYFEVLSTREIQSLLGVERQRQLLGCSDKSECMAEISGGIGARFVMTGTLSRLGEAFQLTLTTLDTQRAQPLGRSNRIERSLESLRATLPTVVAEATATPLPAPPSRVLPYTLLGTGGAAALFGVVWGAVHLSQEQQLASVLDAAGGTPGILGTRTSYEAQLRTLEQQRVVALVSLGVGVAAVVTGAVILLVEGPATRVALVPTGTGAALAGSFP